MPIYARALARGRNWLGMDREEDGQVEEARIHTRRTRRLVEEERERERVRGGRNEGSVGKEDRAEGFITWDLLLLPGGGEPLQRATAVHAWGVFIRYVQQLDRVCARACKRARAHQQPHT